MLRKLTPSVSKHWLLLAAGLVWSLVGAMLCGLAAGWLASAPQGWSLAGWTAGLIASLVIYRAGFVKIAHHNRDRINRLTARTCLFAFYPVKSYLLVAGMMAFGMLLRSTGLPRPYLGVLYLSIGAALFISSLHYYRPAYRGFRGKAALVE